MNVAEVFKQFDDTLKVSLATRSTISARHDCIARILNAKFRQSANNTGNTLYVGSYGRGTAIEGISDVDMLMILPYSVQQQYDNYYGNGQSALLQAVRSSLLGTYPNTNIKGDGQIVQVNFSDGTTFEILPCFDNYDGSYDFPDSNNGGCWKKTYPKAEIEAFKKMNAECNNNLYSLCRMARAWKYYCNVSLKSCLLDLFAYRFLSNWRHKDMSYLYYDFMMRDFLEYLTDIPETQSSWKMVGSNRLYTDYSFFQYKAKVAYNKSLEAIAYQDGSYDWSAHNKWREIFGYKFPSS